jgi:hypothetical protein
MANWPATLAAVAARGPRCDLCGGWTFRPQYATVSRKAPRLCPGCFPLKWPPGFPDVLKSAALENWGVTAMQLRKERHG